MAFEWTPQRIATLRTRWADGSTARAIALEIGCPSRNAILGKAHRMKMVRSPATIAASHRAAVMSRHGEQKAKPVVDVSAPISKTKRGRSKLPLFGAPDGVPVPPRISDPVVVISESRRCSIMELAHGVCRWPLGDPHDESFAYCGAPCRETSPYCLEHRSIAYTTPEQRVAEFAASTAAEATEARA